MQPFRGISSINVLVSFTFNRYINPINVFAYVLICVEWNPWEEYSGGFEYNDGVCLFCLGKIGLKHSRNILSFMHIPLCQANHFGQDYWISVPCIVDSKIFAIIELMSVSLLLSPVITHHTFQVYLYCIFAIYQEPHIALVARGRAAAERQRNTLIFLLLSSLEGWNSIKIWQVCLPNV